jgi:hypothetical protein
MKTAAEVMQFIKNAQVSSTALLEDIASHGVNNILNIDLDEAEAEDVTDAAAEKIRFFNNNDFLMNPETGSVDTVENWSAEMPTWEADSDEDRQEQFENLVPVHAINGEWVEKN